MKEKFFKIMTYVMILAAIAVIMYFGVYFDIQSIATYLVATIFAPVLAFTIIRFTVESKISFKFTQNLTRSITLQRIDPLLN